MAVTRQDLHALLYEALESGEWSRAELHDEVDEVAAVVQADQKTDDDA
jgi:hypothetical protein